MKEPYDIEIARNSKLPGGYKFGGLLSYPDCQHVIRLSDEAACVAHARSDIATQVTADELDAAIARSSGRRNEAERVTEERIESLELEELE